MNTFQLAPNHNCTLVFSSLWMWHISKQWFNLNLLTKLAQNCTGRMSALSIFCTYLPVPGLYCQARILPASSLCLAKRINLWPWYKDKWWPNKMHTLNWTGTHLILFDMGLYTWIKCVLVLFYTTFRAVATFSSDVTVLTFHLCLTVRIVQPSPCDYSFYLCTLYSTLSLQCFGGCCKLHGVNNQHTCKSYNKQ